MSSAWIVGALWGISLWVFLIYCVLAEIRDDLRKRGTQSGEEEGK